MKAPHQIIWLQRFDFGVPLEDVFPPRDIHPRLKFLFEKGFKTAADGGLSVEKILSNTQEPLETRLYLKEMLIYQIHYQRKSGYSAGTYLWLIRHFLGLLPIPLIPECTKQMTFDWARLSLQCQDYLKYGRKFHEDSYVLDYLIVEGLGRLPVEHLILLDYLIVFLRDISKLSANSIQVRKKNLLAIAKYFCGSLFTRPYRPGHNEKDMLPLLVYFLLKWHEIRDICTQTGIMDDEVVNINESNGMKENSSTPLQYKFDILQIRDKDRLVHTEKCYIKDTSAQTDTVSILNKSTHTSIQDRKTVCFSPVESNVKDTSSQTDTLTLEDRSSQTAAQNFINLSCSNENGNGKNFIKETTPLANSTAFLSDGESFSNNDVGDLTYFTAPNVTQYYSILDHDEIDARNQDGTAYEDFEPRGKEDSRLIDPTSCSFFSALDKANDWSNIVGETTRTVKKLDEYIYDDYDTFAKEEFNQLLDEKNLFLTPEEPQKTSKLGWANNILKNLNKSSKKCDNSETNDRFYFKYDDVDDVCFKSNGNINTDTTENNNSDPTRNSPYSSNEKLHGNYKGKSSMYKETKSKINFGLKRFKIKMSFLRHLTPKNPANKSMMDGYFNHPKYEKMKHIKANTL